MSRVMKAKIFAKIQQLSIPFFNTFDDISMMADWLFNFSTFLFSIYGGFSILGVPIFGLG